jgi:hypothetical protein
VDNFLRTQYGYGAARLQVPTPMVGSVVLNRWHWLYHPTVMGLLGALLLAWLLRSCATTMIHPEKTVLWVHHTPETVTPETAQPEPQLRTPLRPDQEKPKPLPKTPPPLLVKKKITPQPRRLMLDTPEPSPEPPARVRQIVKNRAARAKQTVLPQPEITKLQPTQVPVTLTPQQKQQTTLLDTPDIPEPAITPSQLPRPVAPQQRVKTEIPDTGAKMALYDFRPVPASSAPEKIKDNTAGEKPRKAPARLMSGDTRVAVPLDNRLGTLTPATTAQKPTGAADIVSDPNRLSLSGRQSIAQLPSAATSTGQKDRPAAAPLTSSTDFSPVLSKKPTVRAISDDNTRKTSNADEQVEIVGRVIGESPRIENLKRLIFKKALLMNKNGGPYCCTINTITCKLSFVSAEKISIAFSQEKIPFEVLSKLERRLPEGVQSCAY